MTNVVVALRYHAARLLTRAWRRWKFPTVTFGEGVVINGRLTVTGPGSVSIGHGCRLDRLNEIHTLDGGAVVSIGRHCYLNGVEFVCKTGIRTGDHCLLADGLLMDLDFHSVEVNRHDPSVRGRTRPIVLEDNVWVGYRCMVLKGVTIGRNSVVGAGTVVRTSVPANVVVTGGPYVVAKRLNIPQSGENRWAMDQ